MVASGAAPQEYGVLIGGQWQRTEYGGLRDSGFGRKGVKYATHEMTEPKLRVFHRH